MQLFWGVGFPGGSDSKESTCNAGDLGLIPGLGRSLGEGHGNPLQYSCLENPWTEESGGLQVHRVAESDMTEWLSTHAQHHSTSPPCVTVPISQYPHQLDCCYCFCNYYYCHASGFEVVAPCGFDLHFPNDYWCWESFHVFIGHVHILLGEMFIQIPVPFF